MVSFDQSINQSNWLSHVYSHHFSFMCNKLDDLCSTYSFEHHLLEQESAPFMELSLATWHGMSDSDFLLNDLYYLFHDCHAGIECN